jgi:hypothetical protein
MIVLGNFPMRCGPDVIQSAVGSWSDPFLAATSRSLSPQGAERIRRLDKISIDGWIVMCTVVSTLGSP